MQDLDEHIVELRRRGLQPDEIVNADKGVRLSALTDPDGDTVTSIGGFRIRYRPPGYWLTLGSRRTLFRGKRAALIRFLFVAVLTVLAAALVVPAVIMTWVWWLPAALVAILAVIGLYDLLQRQHSVLRNYPVLGHMRFLLEALRPELQQYFIERNFDGRPFDRDVRSLIYARAKGTAAELAFGTERDIDQIGYEYLVHSARPVEPPEEPFRVRVGGPDCTKPYDMALMNVSAMSFGALSANALRALNNGARRGGFAHDTGEGGLTPYHLGGADVIWELGSGYFGARTEDGAFDPDIFATKAVHPLVKCISIKLSQGAKPGIGGVLPAAKVTAEIADYRGVPVGEKCVSPAAHSAFHTPRELIRFVARLRELSDGKPIGFKLCVGSRVDVLATCKAMLAEGVDPTSSSSTEPRVAPRPHRWNTRTTSGYRSPTG